MPFECKINRKNYCGTTNIEAIRNDQEHVGLKSTENSNPNRNRIPFAWNPTENKAIQ